MSSGLSGKVALVTGGASGIGAGIASVLASAGASVAIGDLNSPVGQETGLAVHLDVTDRDSVAQAVTRIEQEYGPVDILVNNAGVSAVAGFLDITDSHWDRIMAVNLRGVLVVTQRVLPGMLRRQHGRIINIASVAGLEAVPRIAPYCASKSGVIALTQSLAKEVARQNVTVNAVCPGIVRTPMWDDPDTGVLREETDGEQHWQTVVADIPQGRPQTPEDIGHACAYLASDQGANITGIALSVSGGQRMH